MLAPIYQLLFGTHYGSTDASLELTEDQITITYKTYKSDNDADLQQIVDQKLAAGKQKFVFYHFCE